MKLMTLFILATACGGSVATDPSPVHGDTCSTPQGAVTCEQQAFYTFTDGVGDQCHPSTGCNLGDRCAAIVMGGALSYGTCVARGPCTPGEVRCSSDAPPGAWGNIERYLPDHTWEKGGCISPPYCRAGACSETAP